MTMLRTPAHTPFYLAVVCSLLSGCPSGKGTAVIGATCALTSDCGAGLVCEARACTKPEVVPVETAAPVAPTALAATTDGAKVSLQWTSVNTTFRVSRATSAGGPYTALGDISAHSYDDTAVQLLGTYEYVVEPVVGGSVGPRSTPVSIRVLSGRELVVADGATNNLLVFDVLQTGNSAPLRTLTMPLGHKPRRLAADRTNNEVYMLGTFDPNLNDNSPYPGPTPAAPVIAVFDRSGNGAVKRSFNPGPAALDLVVDAQHRKLFVLSNSGTVSAYNADTLASDAALNKAAASTCAAFPTPSTVTFTDACDQQNDLAFDTTTSELAVLRGIGARYTVNIYDWNAASPKASLGTAGDYTPDSGESSLVAGGILGKFFAVGGLESVSEGSGHYSNIFQFPRAGATTEVHGTRIPRPDPTTTIPLYRGADIAVFEERTELIVPMHYYASGSPDIEFGEILFLTPAVTPTRAKLSGAATQLTATVNALVLF